MITLWPCAGRWQRVVLPHTLHSIYKLNATTATNFTSHISQKIVFDVLDGRLLETNLTALNFGSSHQQLLRRVICPPASKTR